MGELTINAPAGEEGEDYQIPNMMRAIGVVCCWFMGERAVDPSQVADALEMMAKHIREGE